MSTSPIPAPQQVGILVLDDNAPGGSAVKQILDSEGWRVRLVADTQMLLAELKTAEKKKGGEEEDEANMPAAK